MDEYFPDKFWQQTVYVNTGNIDDGSRTVTNRYIEHNWYLGKWSSHSVTANKSGRLPGTGAFYGGHSQWE